MNERDRLKAEVKDQRRRADGYFEGLGTAGKEYVTLRARLEEAEGLLRQVQPRPGQCVTVDEDCWDCQYAAYLRKHGETP